MNVVNIFVGEVGRWSLGIRMALRYSETEVPQSAWLSFSEMNGNGDTGDCVDFGGGQAKIFMVIGMGRYCGKQGQTTVMECGTIVLYWFQTLAPVFSHQNFRDPRYQLLLLNARLVYNKPFFICDLIVNEMVDLACITETWLGPLLCFVYSFQTFSKEKNSNGWNMRLLYSLNHTVLSALLFIIELTLYCSIKCL